MHPAAVGRGSLIGKAVVLKTTASDRLQVRVLSSPPFLFTIWSRRYLTGALFLFLFQDRPVVMFPENICLESVFWYSLVQMNEYSFRRPKAASSDHGTLC